MVRLPDRLGGGRREARGDLPKLNPEEILAWADAYHAAHGQMAGLELGADPGGAGETWLAVEAALLLGLRGFPREWTLLAFLAEHWRRSLDEEPDFTVDQILAWADAWYERTAQRPINCSPNGARCETPQRLPPLTADQILAWADAHRARTGQWPRCTMVTIQEVPGEEWRNLDAALREGFRGLPGGSSLPRLLARERGLHPATFRR